MQIVHIFGSKSGPREGDGLWAIKYEPDGTHAFRELFGRLEDPEWIYDFCENNLTDLQSKFGFSISVENAAFELMKEGEALKRKIIMLAQMASTGQTLQHIFQPLDNGESNLLELQLSKGSVKSTIRNPKLRVYAVRMDERTYVVTGGAIKLTNRMEERPHTDEELRKMKRVRTWLKDQGIYYREDLINQP